MFLNFGDVLHRRSEYIKKLQADFDPLSRFRLIGGFREIGKNRIKNKHAKAKTYGADLVNGLVGYVAGAKAIASNTVAYC